MILDSILEASVRFFSFVYKLFEQYVVNYFINFGRGFEQIFVMLVITIFMLITIYILIKRVKKLPKSYVIVAFDCTGRKTILKDLRVKFSTYNTALSYSQFYHELYGGQYVFHVTRSMNIANDYYAMTKSDSTTGGYKNDTCKGN
jgi:hypothetical protein